MLFIFINSLVLFHHFCYIYRIGGLLYLSLMVRRYIFILEHVIISFRSWSCLFISLPKIVSILGKKLFFILLSILFLRVLFLLIKIGLQWSIRISYSTVFLKFLIVRVLIKSCIFIYIILMLKNDFLFITNRNTLLLIFESIGNRSTFYSSNYLFRIPILLVVILLSFFCFFSILVSCYSSSKTFIICVWVKLSRLRYIKVIQ
jgi:hypothetical protein